MKNLDNILSKYGTNTEELDLFIHDWYEEICLRNEYKDYPEEHIIGMIVVGGFCKKLLQMNENDIRDLWDLFKLSDIFNQYVELIKQRRELSYTGRL